MADKTTDSRPLRKILPIAFAILIFIGIVSAGLYTLSRTSRLNQQLADLRTRGLPTNGEELNAFYAVPADVPDTTDLWTAATKAIADANMDSRVQGIPIVGKGPTPIPPPGEEWAELEASRALLKELDNEMQLIMLAADAGGMARFPVDFKDGVNALLIEQQEIRTLARLLSLNAHVHAHAGQTPEVLRDVKAIFAVSESIGCEPVIISQMIRMAIHAIGCELTVDMLPHCQWSDEELTSLQGAIAQARFRHEMQRSFQGELALGLHGMDTTSAVSFLGVDVFRSSNKSLAIALLEKPTVALDTSWMEARQESDRSSNTLATVSASPLSSMKYTYVRLMVPAIQLAIMPGIRAEARQNCAIAIIAAYRYRLQHGKLPASLADLQDLIPDADPSKSSRLIDPFDGQPLRFKISGDSVIIYSIGQNEIDNGGDIENERPQDGDFGYSISE